MLFNLDPNADSGTACLPAIATAAPAISTEAEFGADCSSVNNVTRKLGARPLRVMFVQTDMRVGGAEMITANVIRRLDRRRFAPELCCLKERGELGESLSTEIPVHHNLLAGKYDLRVW